MSQALRPAIAVGQMKIRFLIEGSETNRERERLESTSRQTRSCRRRTATTRSTRPLYGLDGCTTWTIDGQRMELDPGEVLHVRRGSIHGFENRHAIDAKFLAIATLGIFGPAYFSRRSARFSPPQREGDQTAAIAETMRRHGLTLAQSKQP